MLLDGVITKTFKVYDGVIIEINENNKFSVRVKSCDNGYLCTVETINGNFKIEKIYYSSSDFFKLRGDDSSNLKAPCAYDENTKSFVIPSSDRIRMSHPVVTMDFFLLVEYQECFPVILEISEEKLMAIGIHQVFKDIIILPNCKNYKFTYYVKRTDVMQVEVHIVNQNNVLINGSKEDLRYRMDISYPQGQDLKLPLLFTFEPQQKNVISSNNKIAPDNPIIEVIDKKVNCSHLYEIMSDKTYADVVLFSSTGKEILTHRCLLARFSKVFKKLFDETADLPVQHKINEFDTEIITAALEFCYGKPDAIKDKEIKLFEFAEKYCIQELKEACCTYFEKNLNKENVCDIIEIAYSNNFENLKKNCIELLAKHKEEIEFDNLPKKIITHGHD